MGVTTCRCSKCEKTIDLAHENGYVYGGWHYCEPCYFNIKEEPEDE